MICIMTLSFGGRIINSKSISLGSIPGRFISRCCISYSSIFGRAQCSSRQREWFWPLLALWRPIGWEMLLPPQPIEGGILLWVAIISCCYFRNILYYFTQIIEIFVIRGPRDAQREGPSVVPARKTWEGSPNATAHASTSPVCSLSLPGGGKKIYIYMIILPYIVPYISILYHITIYFLLILPYSSIFPLFSLLAGKNN